VNRERRRVREAGYAVSAVAGLAIRELPGIARTMHELYLSTIDKQGPYGRAYLTREFFEGAVAGDFCESLVLILARGPGGEIVAGTWNVVGGGDGGGEVFAGRHWGCVDASGSASCLHFECCYYASVEYCIEAGVAFMNPGSGGGDYKFLRGFDPVACDSVHYLPHPGLRSAVKNFCQQEAASIDEQIEYLAAESAKKAKS
jgi:predicted N-acyltransferase